MSNTVQLRQPAAWKLPAQLLVPLLIAIFIEVVVLPRIAKTAGYKNLVEHLTIALMIASILGLTYEFFLNKKRDEVVHQLMDLHYSNFRTLVLDVAQTYAFASPEMILDLLRDIALQTNQIPTLYRISRDKHSEYTFATDTGYFDRLVAVRRRELCETLREWVQPASATNLKFLASDFVGKYRLGELAGELKKEVDIQRLRLNEITDLREKSWTLNYLWAYSRCESPMYQGLGDFLCGDADDWAQNWILFVPLQMPDAEFVQVIERYLESGHATSEANLKAVLSALSALQNAGVCFAKPILDKFIGRFQTETLRDGAQRLAKRKPVRPSTSEASKAQRA